MEPGRIQRYGVGMSGPERLEAYWKWPENRVGVLEAWGKKPGGGAAVRS